MSIVEFQEVEATLLLLSEARERAERAAKMVATASGQEHVVEALEQVDRELLALHRQLMEGTLFYAPPADSQLALDAAA